MKTIRKISSALSLLIMVALSRLAEKTFAWFDTFALVFGIIAITLVLVVVAIGVWDRHRRTVVEPNRSRLLHVGIAARSEATFAYLENCRAIKRWAVASDEQFFVFSYDPDLLDLKTDIPRYVFFGDSSPDAFLPLPAEEFKKVM